MLYPGGYDGGFQGTAFATAEVYDPVIRRWRTTGPLAEARFGFAGARLAKGPHVGDVLVCGGFIWRGMSIDRHRSCERYAPASATWSAAAPLGTARAMFTLTTLPDGRLLAAGGQVPGGGNLATAELYDPIADSWAPATGMDIGRARHTATILPSGTVLVIGGATDDGDVPTDAVALYDPATDAGGRAGQTVVQAAKIRLADYRSQAGYCRSIGNFGGGTWRSGLTKRSTITACWCGKATIGLSNTVHG